MVFNMISIFTQKLNFRLHIHPFESEIEDSVAFEDQISRCAICTRDPSHCGVEWAPLFFMVCYHTDGSSKIEMMFEGNGGCLQNCGVMEKLEEDQWLVVSKGGIVVWILLISEKFNKQYYRFAIQQPYKTIEFPHLHNMYPQIEIQLYMGKNIYGWRSIFSRFQPASFHCLGRLRCFHSCHGFYVRMLALAAFDTFIVGQSSTPAHIPFSQLVSKYIIQ